MRIQALLGQANIVHSRAHGLLEYVQCCMDGMFPMLCKMLHGGMFPGREARCPAAAPFILTYCPALQAGIDDTAKAAGLAVGHLESSAEAVANKVGGGEHGGGGGIPHKVQAGHAAELTQH
jgi:hypothetical protein